MIEFAVPLTISHATLDEQAGPAVATTLDIDVSWIARRTRDSGPRGRAVLAHGETGLVAASGDWRAPDLTELADSGNSEAAEVGDSTGVYDADPVRTR